MQGTPLPSLLPLSPLLLGAEEEEQEQDGVGEEGQAEDGEACPLDGEGWRLAAVHLQSEWTHPPPLAHPPAIIRASHLSLKTPKTGFRMASSWGSSCRIMIIEVSCEL